MAKKTPPPAPAPAPAPPAAAKPSTAMTAPAAESRALTAVDLNSMVLDDAKTKQHFAREDMAIPFLRVLQSNSPQIDNADDRYVPGSAIGDFINTATLEMWDGQEGVRIVPVAFTRSFTEWNKRNEGGGFVKDWGNEDPRQKLACVRDPETGRDVTRDGTELMFSALYFVFIIDPETGARQQVAFPLAGTQMKKSKAWAIGMEMLEVEWPRGSGKQINPPMFFCSYQITTVPEENKKGKWRGVKIERAEDTLDLVDGEAIYLEARAFKNAIMAGEVRVDAPEPEVLEAEPDDAPARPAAAPARPAAAAPKRNAPAPAPPPEQPPAGTDAVDDLPF